jgi:predicted secreted protein
MRVLGGGVAVVSEHCCCWWLVMTQKFARQSYLHEDNHYQRITTVSEATSSTRYNRMVLPTTLSSIHALGVA